MQMSNKYEIPDLPQIGPNYEAAINPRSAEVAALVEYYGPNNPNLVAAIAELPPEDAEELAASLMGRIREVKGL
jgi:hypothetical protein